MLYDLDAGIEAVTAQIAELQKRREALVQAKGALEALGLSPVEPKPEDAATDSDRRTRKQAIVDFLSFMGPTKRSSIVELASIPAGTVSYELNDKETFIRLEDGTWDLKSNHPDSPDKEEAGPDPTAELTEDDIPF